MDANGDIAVTSSDPMESIIDMIRTRVKASLNAWKLYQIGADLENYIGQYTPNPEMELAIQRRILTVLSYQCFPQGMITVRTLPMGNTMQIFIYVQNQFVLSVILSKTGDTITISY